MASFHTISPQGITPDRPPELIGDETWQAGQNMQFRTQYSARSNGAAIMPDQPPVLPGKLIWLSRDGVDWWLSARGAGVWAWDGSAYSDITPVGWQTSNLETYNWTLLNQVPIVNAEGDNAYYWDGNPANPMQPLPDFANYIQGAKSIRAYKNFLVAVAPTGNPNAVAWSDAASPGDVPQTWTPAPDNLAGDIELSEDATALVDACVLRNDLLVYKRNGVYLLQFVGGQFVMASRSLFRNVGILAKECAIAVDEMQYVLGDGNIYRTDGVRVDQIGEGVVRDSLFSSLSTAFWFRSFVSYNPRERQVVFAYPNNNSTGGCTDLLTYNIDQGTFGRQAPPIHVSHLAAGRYTSPLQAADPDWDSDAGPWDDDITSWGFTGDAALVEDVLISSRDNALYASVPVGTWGGLPFESSVQTGLFTMGDKLTRKHVKRLWPSVSMGSGDCVTFEVGTAETLQGAIKWLPAVKCFAQTDKLDYLAQGRYIAVRMRASDVTVPYAMTSCTIEYEDAGRF